MSTEIELSKRKTVLEEVLASRETQVNKLQSRAENSIGQISLQELVKNGQAIDRIQEVKIPLLRRRLSLIEAELKGYQQVAAAQAYQQRLSEAQQMVEQIRVFKEKGIYSASVLAGAVSQLAEIDLQGKNNPDIVAGLAILEARKAAEKAPALPVPKSPEPKVEPEVARLVGKQGKDNAYEFTFPDQQTLVTSGDTRKAVLEAIIRAYLRGENLTYVGIVEKLGLPAQTADERDRSINIVQATVYKTKQILNKADFGWQINSRVLPEDIEQAKGKTARPQAHIFLEQQPLVPIEPSSSEPVAPEPLAQEPAGPVDAEGSMDFAEARPEDPLTEAEQKAICRALLRINDVTVVDKKGLERTFNMEGPCLMLCRTVRDEEEKSDIAVPIIPLSEHLAVLTKFEALIELTENERRENGTTEIYNGLSPELRHLIDAYGIYNLEFGPIFREMLLSPETRFRHSSWIPTGEPSRELNPQPAVKCRFFDSYDYELPKTEPKVFRGEVEVVAEAVIVKNESEDIEESIIPAEDRQPVLATDSEEAVVAFVQTPTKRPERRTTDPLEEIRAVLDEIDSKGSLLSNRQSSLPQIADAFHTITNKRVNMMIENGYIAPEYHTDHHPGLTKEEIALAVILDRYMKGDGGLSKPRVKMYRKMIAKESMERGR